MKGVRNPNSVAQRAIAFIRERGVANSKEIGEFLVIKDTAVSCSLNYYVSTGVLTVEKVRTGKTGPALNHYRIRPEEVKRETPVERRAIQAQPADCVVNHHDPRAPAGLVPGRATRLGPSLSARDIALGRGSGAAVPPADNSATAAHQPAVGENTGSTDAVEPPTAGPCRTPALEAIPAEGAGDIRLSIDNDCQLCVLVPGDQSGLILEREHTRRLGEFLAGCAPLWSAR